MKRIIIAIIFIAISVIIGIYSTNETDKRCRRMESRINSAIELNTEILETSTHDKRIEFYNMTKNLNDAWEETSQFFYFFFNNDDIKDIETNIEKLPTHAKSGDIESTYLCLVEVLEEFEYLKNSTKPDFNNIF